MLASESNDGKGPPPLSRPRIERLPPPVAARIAAGEVIERPASIVKELLENALDAGARSVEVEIEGGGVDLIRIRDDGHGIPPDQLADAFERHATSKLRDDRDLETVLTLGFRGEALAAIAAAAAVDFTTRPAAEYAAAVARIRDGALAGQGSAAAAPGTTVEVRDLFAALPARRRFLASPRAEARACTSVLTDYTLAYPGVSFRLRSGDRTVLRSPGDGEPRSAAGAIYGADIARDLLAVDGARTDERTDEPGAANDGDPAPSVTVHGLTGPPSLHRSNRRAIHLFANGRAIENRALRAAVEQAYEGLLPGGRHPLAVLHIEVPPQQIDVNVHPRKAEVRFRHERLVFSVVRGAVRDALATAPVAQDAPAWLQPTAPQAPESWSGEAQSGLAPPPAGETGSRHGGASPGGAASGGAPRRGGADGYRYAAPNYAPSQRAREVISSARPGPQWSLRSEVLGAGIADLAAASGTGEALASRPDRLPPLRPLGQIDRTFIAAEGPDGLYLIDQHAAHERVLYEQFGAQHARRAAPDTGAAGTEASQPLLATVVVTLTPDRAALLAAEAETLRHLGWVVDAADGSAVMLRAVPQAVAGRDVGRALTDLLDRIDAEERLSGPDRVIASQACRAAVMAGDTLAEAQQRALLADLEAAQHPHTCPHGRPTTLRVDSATLARAFGR